MLAASIAALRSYRRLKVVVSAGGGTRIVKTPLVFIGNNAYEVGFPEMGSRTRLNKGCLGLITLKTKGFAGLSKAAFRLAAGRLDGAADIETMQLPELEIRSSRRRLRIARDGEVGFMKPPLRFRSLHKALRVIVPANNR